MIIGVDSIAGRLNVARQLGANVTLNIQDGDPVEEIKSLTGGRGVDVAIEALGCQETFESALRATRPGGTLSSLGVYSGKLVALLRGSVAERIVRTAPCPVLTVRQSQHDFVSGTEISTVGSSSNYRASRG